MVSIGVLSWKVQVENAAQAKQDAQDVDESVEGAKEAMEQADEEAEGLTEALGGGGLADAQEAAGKGFDKMNAKAGFLGTALQFLKGTFSKIIGGLSTLAGLLLGGGLIVALVALATAFKENIGNIKENFKNLKKDLGPIWESIKQGFHKAMQGLGGAISIIVGVISKVVGVIADLNKRFKIIAPIIRTIITLFGAFAIAWVIVQVVSAIISGFIALIGVAGGVMSGIATLISVFGTIISVMGTIVSVVGTVIAALNPVTLIILAIIAVAVALYAAWKTNFLGIRDIVANVVDTIQKKFKQAVTAIQNAISDAKQVIQNFISGAASFGSDLIDNIVSGVKQAASRLTDAVENVVSKVKEYLPFSPAEVGPLANLDKSGPGLVNTVAKGIEQQSPELAKATKSAAKSAKKGLNDNPPVAPSQAARRTANGGGGGGDTLRKIEINIGGVEIGDQTLDIGNMTRTELRKLGEEIAKVLGDEVRGSIQ